MSNRFLLDPRTHVAFPVPSFRPAELGQRIALDVMPSAGVVPDRWHGFAWLDVCDADVFSAAGGVPVSTARVGIRPDRVEFGTWPFSGGRVLPVAIIQGKRLLALFDATGSHVFGDLTVHGVLRRG